MTKRPPVAARGKDDPKGTAMTALLQHQFDHPAPLHGVPRFTGDWVDAAVVLGHGTIRVDTAERGLILIPDDFETLKAALAPARIAAGPRPAGARRGVQFNEALGVLLVPGGHDRAGRSFFPVRPAGASTA